MTSSKPAWFKPAAWGIVVGAGALAIVGFSTGWIVSSGKAAEMAQQETHTAIVKALTPICVAQFKNLGASDRASQLTDLEKQNTWDRGNYVEKHGWATMPGSTSPNYDVADACAAKIVDLKKS